MTTIKPGSVNQGPLYGCTCCYELQTFPASDLRVHDNECWCYWCWGEYKEAESGIEYADLPAFEPQPAPDVAALVEALEKARDAIASLPKDALGNVPDTQQCQGWHIRDELINDISTALAAHRKGGEA